MSIKTRFITRSALIAAIYAALTLIIRPLSYGPVQFRFSEVLVALPVLMPEAIPGLTIGCLIANVLSHYIRYDIRDAGYACRSDTDLSYEKEDLSCRGAP